MSTRRPIAKRRATGNLWAPCLTLAILASGPGAWAGGMEMPDNGTRALARGGAFTALADDLSAIAHNPGALIKLNGIDPDNYPLLKRAKVETTLQ